VAAGAGFVVPRTAAYLIGHNTCTGKKVKVGYLLADYMSQTRDLHEALSQSWKWQLIGKSQWYRGASRGHPLPALTNNIGPAVQHTDIPPPQLATLGLQSVNRKSYYSFPVPFSPAYVTALTFYFYILHNTMWFLSLVFTVASCRWEIKWRIRTSTENANSFRVKWQWLV